MPPDTADAKSPARRSRIPLRHWVTIVVAVLAIIFIAQNREHHPIHLLWVTVSAPAWLMLTAIFVAGMLVGLLLRRRRR